MDSLSSKIQITIGPKDSILMALKLMDETFKRLLIVLLEEKFIGLLSIGDIQRAIIRGVSLESPIETIMRKDIRVANNGELFETIKQRMLQYRAECMPVVNDKKELVKVYFWEDVFGSETKLKQPKLNVPVVIMAGGIGSRLKPITNVLPKPLIPFGEKTILEEIMDRFVNVGCNLFYLSVNYKAEMIRQYFRTLNNSNYQIEYFQEDKPLGTAGSMYLIKDKINSTFFVSNCDILIDQEIEEIYEFHKEKGNEITIVSALKHYKIPYGTLETGKQGKLITLSEKPELTFQINSGMYILEPHLLNEVPQNEFFHITHLVENILKRNGKVGVFPVSEGSWKDIGNWKEYIEKMSQIGDKTK